MLVKSTLFTDGIGRDQRHRWRNVVFGCLIMVGGGGGSVRSSIAGVWVSSQNKSLISHIKHNTNDAYQNECFVIRIVCIDDAHRAGTFVNPIGRAFCL
jgi:hypothetical protein